ncbi:uncharacterized protein [Nicotiana sylvestris]|uniref:uncharacterized protein n=1 Tax=Nicotiana sylvestris TaxID=4096 RepID=UPI00388C4977
MAEHLSEDLVISHEETETIMTSCDSVGVIIEECARGSEPQREETEEEGAILQFEQPAQDNTTRVPNNEPNPFMEDPGQESSPQTSIDPAPSPRFDAEPLNMVVLETNLEKEDDAYNLVYASFIKARTKVVAKGGSRVCPQKRVKGVGEGEMDVDEETKEKPSSLNHKSSRKKHSHSQFERHTSKGAESSSKSVVAGSSKKLVKNSGDKTVKEHGDKSGEKEVEKSSEHRQNKLVEKEKYVGKSMKRKRDDDDEEPSSVKKGKNSATEEIQKLKSRNTILESQLSQLQEVPGSSGCHSVEVARLTKENVELRKLVEDLKERLLNEQMSANARMDLVLQILASSSKPHSSSTLDENNDYAPACKSPILVIESDFLFAIYTAALLLLSFIML